MSSIMLNIASTSQLQSILDGVQRVLVFLVGRPDDQTYIAAHERTFKSMMMEGQFATFSWYDQNHHRGKFSSIKITFY